MFLSILLWTITLLIIIGLTAIVLALLPHLESRIEHTDSKLLSAAISATTARAIHEDHVEKEIKKRRMLSTEMRVPPPVLLRHRWDLPSNVARELGLWVELIIRDFVMPWYKTDHTGYGLSTEPHFLAYAQYIVGNTLGNLGYRTGRVQLLQLILDDMTEVLRHHLHVFDMVHAAAARQSPTLFDIPPFERIVSQALSHHGQSYVMDSFDRQKIVQAELRRIRDEQDAALIQVYADVGGLHPACDPLVTPRLGGDANTIATSWLQRDTPPSHLKPGESFIPAHAVSQRAYMKDISAQILERIMPPNERDSIALMLVLREIVTNKLFVPLLNTYEPFYFAELLMANVFKEILPREILKPTTSSSTTTTSTTTTTTQNTVDTDTQTTTKINQKLSSDENISFPNIDTFSKGKPPLQPSSARSTQKTKTHGKNQHPLNTNENSTKIVNNADTSLTSISNVDVDFDFVTINNDTKAIETHNSIRNLKEDGWQYYLGNLTRKEAEHILSRIPYEGTFLIRSNAHAKYILSYTRETKLSQISTENRRYSSEVDSSCDENPTHISSQSKPKMFTSDGISLSIYHTSIEINENNTSFSAMGRGPFMSLASLLRNLREILYIGVIITKTNDGIDFKENNVTTTRKDCIYINFDNPTKTLTISAEYLYACHSPDIRKTNIVGAQQDNTRNLVGFSVTPVNEQVPSSLPRTSQNTSWLRRLSHDADRNSFDESSSIDTSNGMSDIEDTAAFLAPLLASFGDLASTSNNNNNSKKKSIPVKEINPIQTTSNTKTVKSTSATLFNILGPLFSKALRKTTPNPKVEKHKEFDVSLEGRNSSFSSLQSEISGQDEIDYDFAALDSEEEHAIAETAEAISNNIEETPSRSVSMSESIDDSTLMQNIMQGKDVVQNKQMLDGSEYLDPFDDDASDGASTISSSLSISTLEREIQEQKNNVSGTLLFPDDITLGDGLFSSNDEVNSHTPVSTPFTNPSLPQTLGKVTTSTQGSLPISISIPGASGLLSQSDTLTQHRKHWRRQQKNKDTLKQQTKSINEINSSSSQPLSMLNSLKELSQEDIVNGSFLSSENENENTKEIPVTTILHDENENISKILTRLEILTVPSLAITCNASLIGDMSKIQTLSGLTAHIVQISFSQRPMLQRQGLSPHRRLLQTLTSKAVAWYEFDISVPASNTSQEILTWRTRHRFSEFIALHKSLRIATHGTPLANRVPTLPSKHGGRLSLLLLAQAAAASGGTDISKKQNAFLERRRAELDVWLQQALDVPAFAASKEFRKFLSPRKKSISSEDSSDEDLSTTKKTSASSSIFQMLPKVLSSTGSSMLDSIKNSSKNRVVKFDISTPSTVEEKEKNIDEKNKVFESSSNPNALIETHTTNTEEIQDELVTLSALGPDHTTTTTPSSQTNQQITPHMFSPEDFALAEARLFTLANELFSLRSRGWIRRQLLAVMRVMLTYMYAGSAATRFSTALERLLSADRVAGWVRQARENMWPHGGPMAPYYEPPTWQQAWIAREESLTALLLLPPSATATLLGRECMESGLIKLHALLQIPVVTQSLMFALFDVLVRRLFPGVHVAKTMHPDTTKLAKYAHNAMNENIDLNTVNTSTSFQSQDGNNKTSTLHGNSSKRTTLLPPLLYTRFLLGGITSEAKLSNLAAAAAIPIVNTSGTVGNTIPSSTPPVVEAQSNHPFSILAGPAYGIPVRMPNIPDTNTSNTTSHSNPVSSRISAVVDTVRSALPTTATVSRAFTSIGRGVGDFIRRVPNTNTSSQK